MTISPWGEFKDDVLDALATALSELDWQVSQDLNQLLEEPPDPKLGDLATTICFELAKDLQKPPVELAQELAKSMEPTGMITSVEATGGYINFRVKLPELLASTLEGIEIADKEYGSQDVNGGEKVVIEHTSVNPTKPLHIGHARNAVLGDTMAKILRALGHEVEVQNYIDDLGLQVAQTLLAYRIIKEKPKGKFDHVLGKLYVDIHQRLDSERGLEREVRKILSELEAGKGETLREARHIAEKCVSVNLETSDKLNIDYDLLVWESDIVNSGILKETLERLQETPYFVEGENEHKGALVLRLSRFGLEDKVIVRSDGTTVYTARDLAYQLWKFGKVQMNLSFEKRSKRPSGVWTYSTVPNKGSNSRFANADRVINVVGSEQKFPQKVVSASLRALGLEKEHKNSHHLAYEHVRLPSKRFVGRLGTWAGYSVDEITDESVSRARDEVEKRNPNADENFINKTAEDVGVGAIRYALIQTSPEKEVVFKWDEALNFERNSGPAVQYSHARACSILRKAGVEAGEHPNDVFEKPQEHQLIKQLAKFPTVVQTAGEQFQPHLVATYAADLALTFNKFYEVAPVIRAGTKELKVARLRLVNCTRIVLRNALELMGIEAPERM